HGRPGERSEHPAAWPDLHLERHLPARDRQVAMAESAPGGNRTRIEGLGSLRPATRLPALAAAEAGHALLRLSPSGRANRGSFRSRLNAGNRLLPQDARGRTFSL